MKKISFFILAVLQLFFFAITGNAKKEEEYVHHHIVDFDHPLSFEEICARYHSFDFIDGEITETLQFKSDYEKDVANQNLKVQEYPLEIYVKNSRGYHIERQDIISVRDFTAPELSISENNIIIDSSREDIKERILTSVRISDNWDKEFSSFYWEGLEDLKNGEGTYLIGLRVADQSENISSSVYLSVTIIESIKKRIATAPIYIDKKPLTSDEIVNEFLKSNTIEFDYKTIEIQSTYFEQPTKNGIYKAEIKFFNEEDLICIYQVKIMNELQFSQQKNTRTAYIILGVLVLFISIGVFVYRKRR